MPGQPPFRADHIGSLLRPQKLRQAFRAHAAKEISDADFRAAQDAAIPSLFRDAKIVQAEQIEDAGLLGAAALALQNA